MNKKTQGFTLLEMSIVLTLIGVLTSGGMMAGLAFIQKRQEDVTKARMEVIHSAIYSLILKEGRLPCPADRTFATSNASYGVEQACASVAHSGNTAWGSVPTRTLSLPDEYMYDGWGRRFTYFVDTRVNAAAGLKTNYNLKTTPYSGDMTIKNTSNITITNNVIYALVSHGKNGHGAYSPAGVVKNAGSTSTYEQANCVCNSSGASSGSAGSIYVGDPILDPASVTYIDDIASYRTRVQLAKPISLE